MRTAGIVVAVGVVLCALTGCQGSGSDAASSSAAIHQEPASAAAPDLGSAGAGSSTGSAGAGADQKDAAIVAPIVVQAAPSVIKTAILDLSIPHGKLSQRIDAARAVAGRAGGYISSSSSQADGSHSSQIVMRVPAASFEAAVTSLKGLGTVRSSHEAGQDITRQLIDLNARLVNLQAQRKVLLGLMQKAKTISASIQVENELSQVQGQIEELSGQRRYLNDRAAMSTITLTMVTAGPPPATPQHATALWQALSRSADAAQSVVTAVIVAAGFVIPIALIAGLVALLARRFRPGQVATKQESSG